MKKIWKVISIGDCLKNRSTILFTNRRLKSNHDFSRHMCVLQACWMYLLWVMIGSLDYLHLLWLATSRFSLYPVSSPLLYSASNARRCRHTQKKYPNQLIIRLCRNSSLCTFTPTESLCQNYETLISKSTNQMTLSRAPLIQVIKITAESYDKEALILMEFVTNHYNEIITTRLKRKKNIFLIRRDLLATSFEAIRPLLPGY